MEARHKGNLVRWTALTLLLGLTVQYASGEGSVKVGKNPGEVKGRWLEVMNVEELGSYQKVYVGNVESDIQWKKAGKETPVDEKLLEDKIKEHLLKNLRASGVFAEVLDGAPEEGEKNVVRLDCDLLVEPGNRAVRYAVGYGAGKSKSILEIHLRDHATKKDLGLYHGYGTGSGMGFKVAGGGARKMTQDDIQENAKKFAELLKEVL